MSPLRPLAALAGLLIVAGAAAAQGPTDHLLVNVVGTGGVAPDVVHFDETGAVVGSTPTGSGVDLTAAAFTPDGGFVATATNPRRVVRYSAAGVQVGSFPTPELRQDALDVDVLESGVIAVTDGFVHYYDAAGTFLFTDTQYSGLVYRVKVDPFGGHWVIMQGGGFSVFIARVDGLGGPPTQGFWIPFGFDVAPAPDGTLWVPVLPVGTLERFTRDGTSLGSILASTAAITAAAATTDGDVWVATLGEDRVDRFDASGANTGWVTVDLGTAGMVMDLDVGRPAHIGVSLCSASPNSAGVGARVRVTGSPSPAENELILDVTGLPPGSAGYFLMSDATGQVPVGQGVLCLASPVARFSLSVLTSSPGGWSQFRPDLANLPLGIVILPGSTWHFQMWYRDANPGAVSNLSEAVSVTFL